MHVAGNIGAAMTVDAIGSIEPRAAEIRVPRAVAIRRVAAEALRAATACLVRQHDVVAGCDRRDGGPDPLNDPGTFVAEHRRQRHRKVLMPRVGVRLANAARHHPDQHLIGARFVELQLCDLEAGSFALGDGCFDGDHSSSAAAALNAEIFCDLPVAVRLLPEDGQVGALALLGLFGLRIRRRDFERAAAVAHVTRAGDLGLLVRHSDL